jgi:cysteine desulfurase
MMSDAAYLDHNATAPVKPDVVRRMAELLGAVGNPSSVHRFGRAARRIVEAARQPIAALVGASPDGVIFTASGTEANNLALSGFPGRRILVSTIEHESVLRPAGDAKRIAVTSTGVIDLAAAERLLADEARPALVSVMLANNETGVIQPIQALADIVHRHGSLLHSDAVQAPGRIAIDMAALGIDLLTLSAHKIGGPLGAACLVLRRGLDIAPLLLGGGQERGKRAGTENVPAIGGFGRAAELAPDDLADAPRLAELRAAFEAALAARVPEIEIYGGNAPRLPNTSCFGLAGLKAETQLMALDLAGIAVSAGSACSSGKMRPSHVLVAMGVVPEQAGCAIRVSLGPTNTAADTARLVERWSALAARHRLGQAA